MTLLRPLLCLAALLAAPLNQAAQLALVGGTLIDGTDAPPLPNSVVLIDGSDIVAVGTVAGLRIPDGYTRISTEGMTVLPGLWDNAVQLQYAGHPDPDHWLHHYGHDSATLAATATQLLQAGVTSVRDVGAGLHGILQLRQALRQGASAGPKLFASGPVLIPTKGPVRPSLLAVDGSEDAEVRTRELIEQGVDLIRIGGAAGGDEETLSAIVAMAHRYGLRVVAGGSSDAEIRRALAAGVDELLHIGVDTPLYSAELLQLIRARTAHGPPLYWTPTVGQVLGPQWLALDREWLDDPRNYAGLTPMQEQDLRQAIAQHAYPAPSTETIDTLRRKLAQLQQAGVRLVFGSGLGQLGQPPAQATWRELDYWVNDLGMEPAAALRWATAEAADYVGMGAITGTITRGRKADLIAVPGNPLRHLEVLGSPVIVIRHGVRYR
ncbi:MAG TPA: amidohydrolase family protein [Hyphomicrobiales bacterium]|nr:amidohydrolase family protein [Hyphomicrobiales bacterium]